MSENKDQGIPVLVIATIHEEGCEHFPEGGKTGKGVRQVPYEVYADNWETAFGKKSKQGVVN